VNPNWFLPADAAGNPVAAIRTKTMNAAGDACTVEIHTRQTASPCTVLVTNVKVACAVANICYVTEATASAADAAAQASQQRNQALSNSAANTGAPTIFEPWTKYTITVSSQAASADGSNTVQFQDTADFYTGGPPGVPDAAK
jgi:hypothetical protein